MPSGDGGNGLNGGGVRAEAAGAPGFVHLHVHTHYNSTGGRADAKR